MTDETAPVRKHLKTAKEISAGIKAAEVWYHDLAAAHLLKTQAPIRDQPTDQPGGGR